MWSVGIEAMVTVALHELLGASAFSDGMGALMTKIEAAIIKVGGRALSLAISSS